MLRKGLGMLRKGLGMLRKNALARLGQADCGPSGESGGSVATDRAALIALYQATDGPNWTNNTRWLSDRPLDEWYGVTTDDNGRVTVLNLGENDLSGVDSC